MVDAGACRILVIGDEILSGATKDTNSGWLAEHLDALGYRVERIVTLPDVEEVIIEEARHALDAAPWVFASGGLGPTHDDRTTAALARMFGAGLVLDEAGFERMERRYTKRFGGDSPPTEMIESAKRMVTVPAGARLLVNPRGSATPYVLADARGHSIVVLPGVPAELTAIFETEIAGKLLAPRTRDEVAILEVAMAEAAFAADLARIAAAYPDVSIGSYPHTGELRVTLRFRGAKRDEVERARQEFAKNHPAFLL
ncbi:MAG: competence/damage-inducible protein A [Thermoplasmatota archaeon]